MKFSTVGALAAFSFVAFSVASAKPLNAQTSDGPLKLASVFTDHMVLQRQMEVPVWGFGVSGSNVTVSVAGQSASTTVGDDGRWKLELPELPAGGPYQMKVTGGETVVAVTDVLVGEVWIASGQSNMKMEYTSLANSKKLWKQACDLPIRSLPVPRTVNFLPQESMQGKWQVKPCSSAVAMTFALDLQQALDIPVGIIETSYGSSSIEGWMPESFTQKLPHFARMLQDFQGADRQRVAAILKKEEDGGSRSRADDIFLRTRPNVIYNAMMAPLAPYGCRGILWYQGEANTKSIDAMRQYAQSLPMWVEHLRELWGREDLHVMAVMLPRYGRISGGPTKDPEAPDAHSWAWFRESQQKLLGLPHTGIANTIDLGHKTNIHPKDKQPIGNRLSLLAQHQIHGKQVAAYGPTFKQLRTVVRESKAGGKTEAECQIQFEHAVGLTTVDGKPPREFWGLDETGKWEPAIARIEGDRVILRFNGGWKPKAVRYAFSGYPDVNLVNESGLPALPFRTDQ